MKVLVLGGNGMLGHKLIEVLGNRFEVFASLRRDDSRLPGTGIISPDKVVCGVDALKYTNFDAVLREVRPDVIVNAIGVIKQKCESKDPLLSIEINSLLPHKLAKTAAGIDARLITFSTDCVFSGRRGNYTEFDLMDADDMYGRSKALGEIAGPRCLTLRASLVGRELEGSHSLLEWFLSKKGEKVKGFAEALFSGLTTLELSRVVGDIIEKNPKLEGVYHLSGESISKYDLLLLIDRYFDLGTSIERDVDFKVDRSLDSSQFKEKTGYVPKPWEEMVREMARDSGKYAEWRSLEV